MKRNLIAALIGSFFLAVSATFAAEGSLAKLEWTGAAGLGGQVVDTKDTVDEGKLREYRDMKSGLLTLFDLRGRSSTYYLDLFAENLGRKDMTFDLKGGSYGNFKYRLFSDSLEHFFTTGARTPYSGAGTTTQRAVLPNLDPSTWNSYDLAYKRRSDGGMFEMSFGSPWYLRADVGSIVFDGNKLQAYPQGTSSGQGFVDLAVPVDYKTTNYSIEAGYSTRRLHVALAYLDSKFSNDHEVVTWTNGYFGNSNPPATAANLGIDASYLSPDNKMTRLSLNGVARQLFWNSSLGVRYTSSDWTSDATLATSQLIGNATLRSTAPFLASPGRFDGDVQYDTWAVTWSASPVKWLDLRLYANELKRENHSSHLLFSGFITDTNSLGCVGVVGGTGPVGSATGPRVCTNEPFSYDRSAFGTELAFRPNRANRITLSYDDTDTDREFHPDSDSTKQETTSLEWRNTSLETLTLSLKVQRIARDSNFLAPALPNTVWAFDVANMDRDVYKLGLDYAPSATVDLTAEYYFKKSDYTNSPAGRQADDRSEIYLGATLGKSDGFRFKAYVDSEKATTDARLVSRNSTTGLVNYTVFTGVEDKFDAYGLGFDWPATKRLMITGAASWNKSKGQVDFNGLAGAAVLPTTLVNIPNYGNNEKMALNFKGTYEMNTRWDLTAGLAYEDVSFDDIQFNPYSYILPTTTLLPATQGTAAYLSGWYRDPAYKATIGYLMAKFKF